MSVNQREYHDWVMATWGPKFGIEAIGSMRERALRFVEEALEVGHAAGLAQEDVQLLMERRVYASPAGLLPQEIGQASNTLKCLAEVTGVNADYEAQKEFERVRSKSREHWEARHSKKLDLGISVNGGERTDA